MSNDQPRPKHCPGVSKVVRPVPEYEECPNCKGLLKRLIGAGSGPIFKGSGFYQTDYKNKSSKNDNKSASSEKKEDKIIPKSTEPTKRESTS